MIVFILNTFLYFIKVLEYSWTTNEQLFLKSIYVIFLILILKILHIYPKQLSNDSSAITNYYKIHNLYDKILTFTVIMSYIILFIGCIFYLRLLNRGRMLDLASIWNNIYANAVTHTIVGNFVNIVLAILLILLYIVLLVKVIKIFKIYWIKLHIYYSRHENNWYNDYIKDWLYIKYNYKHLITCLELKFPQIFNRNILGFPVRYHLILCTKRIHYTILFIFFLYDIAFNNWVLYTVYQIFPYIFLYDTYIKFCDLYDSLDYLYSADYTLNRYIYAKTIKIVNNIDIYLDGDYYELESLAKVILIYLKNNLNAKLLCIAIDGEDYYNSTFYDYSYYKDWKKNA